MKTQAVREKLEAAGLKIATHDQTAPDYLGRFVQSETAKWGGHHQGRWHQYRLTLRALYLQQSGAAAH